ncbi:hypothetical protein HOLleu_29164 [Holothuria leucospilota]|uniref:exodeoxyribonuclease III n=1 Tax=Holothuria leucospilota TaxID=206669 RepID=A0A9Q1BNI8_HOLLE|nr:hypothetical protein HOLleu_29164 [Holothuria leucospilota]
MILRIATFNVNGLHDKRKFSKVIQGCKIIIDADILLLQETFLSTPLEYELLKDQWGDEFVFSPSVSSHSGGVCIAFRDRLSGSIFDLKYDSNGRFVAVLCTIKGYSFRVCNVYAPNVQSDRHVFFKGLYRYLRGTYPVILAGDFNCVLKKIDRYNVGQTTPPDPSRDAVRELIHTFQLADGYRAVHPQTPGHTWFRVNSNQSSRIDRIYVPKEVKVCNSETFCLPYSDHNPVYVDFVTPNTPDSNGKSYWKYNVSLNRDKDFCRDLRHHYQMWSSLKPGFDSLSDWWENIKGRIREHAIKHSKSRVRKKRERLTLASPLLSLHR